MRKIVCLLFFVLSLPVHSQNFRLNLGTSRVMFSNINDRRVSFNGINAEYSYYLFRKAGIYLGYNYYFPSTYFSIVRYWDWEDNTATANITGGAHDLEAGMKIRFTNPSTGKIEVSTTIAWSVFFHKGNYDKEQLIRYYGGTFLPDIRNRVLSVYIGPGIIFKAGNLPVSLSGGYNQVVGQGEPYDEWDGYSMPFSSSAEIRIGISLPVMRGPAPSEIKMIRY